MFTVFILGTAGSGKSMLTASFSKWLKMSKHDVTTLNLDPGVLKLPYSPDADVRNQVDVGNLMETYGLGPNGALILASDIIASEIHKLSREIKTMGSDITLVDTPGQMELFAFRESGPVISQELAQNPKAIVYLFDAVFSVNPMNYISNLFLSAAVYTRFHMPQLHLLSKCDLIPKKHVNRVMNWSKNPRTLEASIDETLKGTQRLLGRDMMHAIYKLDLRFPLIPVSAKTNEGMIAFNMALERVLAEGERYTN